MPVSIFIQTLNEEANLPGLLDSVAFADDIVVLDSLSSDRTKAIALERACRWFERPYDAAARTRTGPWRTSPSGTDGSSISTPTSA